MKHCEIAMAYFGKGFNCCQSVLLAFREEIGLEEQRLLDLAGGFGSGAGSGELCGAISGGVMALGLLTPVDRAEPVASKRRSAALARELQERFRERFTRVRCHELLHDVPAYVPDERTPAAKAMGLSKHCQIMVVTAVELVEELLAERGAQ